MRIKLLLFLLFSSPVLAESYYFKDCRLSETVSGDYIINFDKNVINVTLKISDGTVQKFTDKIKLITNDRIISEIIQKTNKKFSTQYFLDVKSNSIIRQLYKKDDVIGLVKPEGKKNKGLCLNVKADWFKPKKKENKKQVNFKSSLPKCVGNEIKNWTNCQGIFKGDDYQYIGEWQNAKQHGNGIEVWKDGRKFIGEFKNDKRNGRGVFLLSDGSKYSGQYKNGKLHGVGKFLLANGDKYEGQFQNGKQHGEGKYTFSSGKIHSGKFVNGEMITGTAIFESGEKYSGQFEFDKPSGKGTIVFTNGSKFIGNFLEGNEYGEGVCVQPSGSSKKCFIESSDIYLGKNTYKILIIGEWSKLEEQTKIRENLIKSFKEKSFDYCSILGNGKFKVLEQKVEVMEVDETPAFGLEPVYKLGVNGISKCS